MSNNNNPLACKFTTEIIQESGQYIVELPDMEIEYGTLSPGDICQISVHTTELGGDDSAPDTGQAPPVTEGDRLTVEIEDMGDQGDGITRVDRGYVVIVPGTAPGDEVDIEVIQTTPNYAFAHIVEEADETEESTSKTTTS